MPDFHQPNDADRAEAARRVAEERAAGDEGAAPDVAAPPDDAPGGAPSSRNDPNAPHPPKT